MNTDVLYSMGLSAIAGFAIGVILVDQIYKHKERLRIEAFITSLASKFQRNERYGFLNDGPENDMYKFLRGEIKPEDKGWD